MGYMLNSQELYGYTWAIERYEDRIVLGLNFGKTPVRVFRLNMEHPLTYVDDCGDFWLPNKVFDSDCASIPLLVSWLPDYQKDRFKWPFFHDSAYRTHAHTGHGLWRKRKEGSLWEFVNMNKPTVDKLCCHDMALAEGARRTQADAFYYIVRFLGRRLNRD